LPVEQSESLAVAMTAAMTDSAESLDAEAENAEVLVAQRQVVLNLAIEIERFKSHLKNLKKEFEKEVKKLSALESGDRTDDEGAEGQNGEEGEVETVGAGDEERDSGDGGPPCPPGSPQSNGDQFDRRRPADAAGTVRLEHALAITPGRLEKLNEQEVFTVAQLESYMNAGKFVPGRVKGLGQSAIDAISDELISYRLRHPVPQIGEEPSNGPNMEPSKGSCDSQEQQATIQEEPGTDRAELQVVPETASKPQMSSQLLVPEVGDLPARKALRRGRRKRTDSDSLVENHGRQSLSGDGSVNASVDASSDSATAPALPVLPNGDQVDGQAYKAGMSAAIDQQPVSANPHSPGTLLWLSWDMGWQHGF
jgi:hypothetical protein